MLYYRKPRTQKSKRALERRESKIIENTKRSLFLYGQKTSETVRHCLKDMYSLKKQDAQHLQKKNPILPFEDILPVERLSQKHDASLFCMATHSKKRPNNIILGRMFDHHLLDMVELGLENYKGLSQFKNTKISAGTKPCIIFSGAQFEDVTEFRRLKNLLIDFFRGVEASQVRLQGFEHTLQFTAVEGKVLFRSYKILLKKSGTRIPRVELEEIGPSMTLQIRRNKFASEDLMKRACRQPKQLKANKVKNVSKNVFGTKLGRVHMTKQDMGKLQTRKMKGLKKATQKKDENSKKSPGEESKTSVPMDIDL
ncbi:ribosome production factor 2 homolog [Homarus americanus]|nr:ribosome production factor 2 homolog [Homarus americanus]